MTHQQPPKLALVLLHRFLPDDEALAGDLIEEFHARQSRVWFWTQALAAIAMGFFRRDAEIRPLRLVDGVRFPDAPARDSLRRINLSGSPVEGIGGLGLVAITVLMTTVAPQAWWLVLGSLLAGAALGIALIAIRRRAD